MHFSHWNPPKCLYNYFRTYLIVGKVVVGNEDLRGTRHMIHCLVGAKEVGERKGIKEVNSQRISPFSPINLREMILPFKFSLLFFIPHHTWVLN